MQPMEMVALVGAGNMGSGIAQKAAQEGFSVQLVDRDQPSLDRGIVMITNTLEEAEQLLELSRHYYLQQLQI